MMKDEELVKYEKETNEILERVNSKITMRNNELNDGQFTKLVNNGKLFTCMIVDKVSDIFSFGNKVIDSADNASDHVFEIFNKQQGTIEKVIEAEITKDNPSQEQLHKMFEEQSKIRQDAMKVNKGKENHNTEILVIVGGIVLTVLSKMINNNNNRT
jgi:hypothetical protein